MRIISLFIVSLFFLSCEQTSEPTAVNKNLSPGMEIVVSQYDVDETADRFQRLLQANNMIVMNRFNHHLGAASAGIELNPTMVFVFGRPEVGTPLMLCSETVAIDLPQKALIMEKKNGDVILAFNKPSYLKQRHQLEGCDENLDQIEENLDRWARQAAGLDSE